MNADELRKRLGLPKAGRVVELSAEEYAKAGDAKTALRIREGLEAKKKRDAALKRTHVDRCSIRVIGKPPSINQLLRGARKQMRVRNAYKELCREGWERANRPVLMGQFRIAKLTMWLADKKDDASNNYLSVVKILLDALKNCGCIENDSRRFHVGPDFQGGGIEWIPADHYMVEMTLEKAIPSGEF